MSQIDVIAWAKRAAEAARKCHEWMQGEFSDSDFDRDGKLSEADAAAFTVAYDADKAIAAIAALHSQAQEREGWVLVPRTATEEMLEAGRSAVMARDCSGSKWGPADHYRAAGISREGIPDHLFEGRQKMSKAWCAELVYCAMLAAAPTGGSET